jgi:hypothetical protein
LTGDMLTHAAGFSFCLNYKNYSPQELEGLHNQLNLDKPPYIGDGRCEKQQSPVPPPEPLEVLSLIVNGDDDRVNREKEYDKNERAHELLSHVFLFLPDPGCELAEITLILRIFKLAERVCAEPAYSHVFVEPEYTRIDNETGADYHRTS